MSTIDKERDCILLTAKHVIPETKPSLSKRAFRVLIKDLVVEPLLLMPVIMAIYIVCLPVTIYEIFRDHRAEKLEYLRLVEKFYNFKGHQGEKHIFSLWHEYGVNPKNFFKKEEELAQCLSTWIQNLYNTEHHISKEKIMGLFENQQKQQAESYSRGLETGMMLNFVNYRIVVVDKLLQDFPQYA